MKGVALWTAALALAAFTSAGAQRLDMTATGFTARQAPRGVDVRDTTRHPTGSRIASAFWMGVAAGYMGLHVGWITGGLTGYFTGVVLGGALVDGKECGFAKRLGVSLAGAVVGGALSALVAPSTHMAKDWAAVGATLLIGGAPVVGSAIALRRCD